MSLLRCACAVACALAAISGAPAWAMFKCTDASGRVSFQDAPCSGKGERLEVNAAPAPRRSSPEAAAAAGSSASTQTEAQRLEKVIKQSQGERRRTDLEALLVPNARAAISQVRTQCDQEIATLRARKSTAANNLAGATYESSLSQEMQAVATRCDTRQRELQSEHDTLRAECVTLGGCKS